MKVKEFFDKFNSSACNNINDVENLIEDNYSCVKYENNNNLEVIATVDYAIVDLKNQNKEITLENIKTCIASDNEWKQKLDKDFFTDEAIIKAMNISKTLLNSY